MANIIKEFYKTYEDLSKYYSFLINKTKKNEYVGITNEWLVDNYYLLAEIKNNIQSSKKDLKKDYKLVKSNYYLLKNIANNKNYNLNFKSLIEELNQYQNKNHKIFNYKEISSIIYTLIIVYIERLNNLCREEYQKLVDKEDVSKIIKENRELKIEAILPDDFDVSNNTYFIFELNNQMSKTARERNILFKELNENLKKKSVSLKELVNQEYQKKVENNILISNIFTGLKEFLEIPIEDMYEKVSKTEKLLLTDPIYKNMTFESKITYRRQIVKLAKKHHLEEYNYLEKIFTKEEHIGFKIFKKKSNKIKVTLYLTSLLVISISLSIFLAQYFIKLKILGFLILFIPISQITKKIMDETLTYFIHPTIIPKLDYSKKIPPESKTMVVIPTIIQTEEKIKAMFDKLESFYLMNKTDNLYFTLLGDTKESKKKVESYDKIISEYGKKYAEELNAKYKKDIFFFIYRKRVWTKCENSYLGYERKRGALLQFNKILLGEYVDEEKYYNVNMLHNNDLGIKYVITLDVDTKLSLNSITKLVGAMAHPMNKPVLNKEGTKVIDGYALLQPKISIDIETTNRSLYSQLFAEIGGFETYSSVVPNFYQDVFKEGSFVGKGIYDLKIFSDLLDETFPENLILSHDLLEGNYLRCGFISDAELLDDFPARFLIDTKRQHRWARGDTQIIGWIKNKVKNKKGKQVKNPINILGKYKILDNIIRMFLEPMLLLILLLSFTKPLKESFPWIFLVLIETAIPVFIFLFRKLNTRMESGKKVNYKNLYYGGKSLLLRSYIVIATIPYYTKLYMDAFFRTLYRLNISHKHLLQWTTAEEVEKTLNNSLINYIRNFDFNIITGTIFIIMGMLTKNYIAFIPAFIFITAPFLLYEVSKHIDYSKIELKEKKIDEIKELSERTWKYFEDNLREEYNYLIPDNYQENREQKADKRTSPTAIGYSLTSIVSAYELELIDKEKAIFLLEKILKSIQSLEKWHGHLYNWYNIITKEVMIPHFISTVDSGNLVASLIVTQEFLRKQEKKELVLLCDRLIRNTNFKKLYTKRDVFSIGYDDDEGKLMPYNYNKFASESRLTSYIAICLGFVPVKHWMAQDKTLTTYKRHKGLISWSGTAFEYYMPFLFMRNYPNTLLDETYYFAHLCQKNYVNKISYKLPWGISESGYNELDDSQNYKYKAFSVPYLKAKEDKENRIVLSPYSSLMVLEMFPEDVYNNIKKFKSLNMYSTYGLYEAYDYNNKGIVQAYFSHHQGMILIGLTNYLKKDVIKKYFHANAHIRAFELLLKEKVQVKAIIDVKIEKYKKYTISKENIENDIRIFNQLRPLPEMTALSNKNYTLIMDDRGNSLSRYRTLQLNRYRKMSTQSQGIFLFIKDLKTNHIWSNTYSPMNTKPDKYEVVLAADKIKYVRRDGEITTKTGIVISNNYHTEIRRITLKNESEEEKTVEITSYTEPIICDNMDDISHKAFNNMFIHTKYDPATHCLIAKRKNRKDFSINSYMFMKMMIKEPLEKYTYETEKNNFIGRNNELNNAKALNNELTNYCGDNLDPVLSLRNKIVLPPNESVSIYLLVGFGRSIEQINEILKHYNNTVTLKEEFKNATLMNFVDTKNMNITKENMMSFHKILNYLYQEKNISITDKKIQVLSQNAMGQNGLWKYGISGDRPIITIEIKDIRDMSLIYEVLKLFEYYKNKLIFVDIIIINSEKNESKKMIEKEIKDEMYRIYTMNSFYHTPGDVTVINEDELTSEDRYLINTASKLLFVIEKHVDLKKVVEEIEKNIKIEEYDKIILEENKKTQQKDQLIFDNGFGGFKENGKEYVIYNKNTPMPWVNVIANKTFGTIISNNGCGYTYAYNSGEFKITPWTNETIKNEKSEGFKFNGKIFDPEKCTHGFGYSILESETNELFHEITEFVAVENNVKFYLLKLKNNKDSRNNVKVEFFMKPVLGRFEELTAPNILTEYVEKDNYLKMRNVYSISYGDISVFTSSSENIEFVDSNKILEKTIGFKMDLDAKEEKTIVFILGSSNDDKEILNLVNKYKNIATCKKELKAVKEHWNNLLGKIQVYTPDESFNYVINGWYLYQTMSSRILAKAGFYQVSGAFGYRDQLQDSLNIVLVKPEYTKMQILINASHQFEKGDTLHWWNEHDHFGLRSRYKDDYLWLVYATLHYIKVTGDYKILEEKVPYIIGEELSKYETEKGIVFHYSEKKESLLNHCLKSLELSMNSLGPHKIPLMGGGDWNDGMNRVGIKGKGESVWLGLFLYSIIDSFKKVMQQYKKDFDCTKYTEFNEKLRESINNKAWDGEYYLRAFYDNGDKLGSHENRECKIDLLSQSFAILSQIIPKNRVQKVLDSVERQLVDKKNNIIKLLTPAFSKTLNNPGYIMSYPAGIRENGGQYTHSVSWYLMALIQTGNYEKAYEYYQMINPINRTQKEESVEKYKVEPYVIAADIYSSENFAGRGGWTWYTGSAGWFYRVGVQNILGIKKQGNKIKIEPSIPMKWKGYKAIYQYLDTPYNIKVVRGNEIYQELDGKRTTSKAITLKNDGKEHEITISIMKEKE